MVSRGIWVKYSKCISKFTKISQATAVASDIWGVLKYHEPVLSQIPQRNCAVSCLCYKAKKFHTLCKWHSFYMYFKFGSNTTGLSQSNFRNLSVCSITPWIVLRSVHYHYKSFLLKKEYFKKYSYSWFLIFTIIAV